VEKNAPFGRRCGPVLDATQFIGSHDVLLVTLDSLRYDVARDTLSAGRTPRLAELLPGDRWQERRSPGTFTFPAHQAFFAGFLPTPVGQRKAGRLFACNSLRGTTVTARTYAFNAPDIVTGLAELGYHTVCVGGVGFFSKQTRLGRVLPGLFDESYWSPTLGVDDQDSTQHQCDVAVARIRSLPLSQRVFLFMNVAATHAPHWAYLDGPAMDSIDSMAAALAYVDIHIGRMIRRLRKRRSWLVILCSDHGEAFGEDGLHGHGFPHPAVWTVPYAEFALSPVHPEEC
jgi:hypothetical protein